MDVKKYRKQGVKIFQGGSVMIGVSGPMLNTPDYEPWKLHANVAPQSGQVANEGKKGKPAKLNKSDLVKIQ